MEIRKLFILVVLGLLLSSCAQITPLHSARTEGAGNLTFTPSVDGTGYLGNVQGVNEVIIAPGIRGELAYGLTDKVDIIASLHSAGSIKTSLKFQLYGDNYTSFAFAAMPGYEYQANIYNAGSTAAVQRLHFPLMVSIRASEIFDYYVGPNLVLQFSDDPQNSAFPGLFGGFEFGKRVKTNVGAGIFLPYTFNIGASGYLYQFGISARIPIFSNN